MGGPYFFLTPLRLLLRQTQTNNKNIMSKNVTITRTEKTPSIPLSGTETAENVTLDQCAGESADFEDNGLHENEIFLAPASDKVIIDRKKFGKAWVYYMLGKLIDGTDGEVIDPEYWFNVNTLRRQDNKGKKVFKDFTNLKDAKQRIEAVCNAGGIKADSKESTYEKAVFDDGKRVRVPSGEGAKQAYAGVDTPFIDLFLLTADDWKSEVLKKIA